MVRSTTMTGCGAGATSTKQKRAPLIDIFQRDSEQMDSLLNDRFSIAGINADGVPFKLDCGVYAKFIYPEEASWAFPVGNQQYPPEMWYVATVHDISGKLNNGYKHTGIDLNLDVSPWGDVERTIGLAVYAVADGIVTYITDAWSGVPMLVVRVEHNGAPLWIRYGHIMPVVMIGQAVKAGQALGGFANYKLGGGGDHLHVDCALDEFTREWLHMGIGWIDPVTILSAHLDPLRVQAMLRKG